MSRNGKIILSAVVAIAAVSMLFAVVPINETFIVSYIFADIAICFVAGTVYAYGKGSAKAAAGLSYIYTSVIYAALSLIFSLIACIVSLPFKWTLTVHIILLAVFKAAELMLLLGKPDFRLLFLGSELVERFLFCHCK